MSGFLEGLFGAFAGFFIVVALREVGWVWENVAANYATFGTRGRPSDLKSVVYNPPMPSDAKTPEQIVRRYLERMRDIRGSGPAPELAFYPALDELLNAVGAELKPKVAAVSQLGQQGHGHPDFGFYTAEQIKRGKPSGGKPSADSRAVLREKPARGVAEVKGLAADIPALVRSEQVAKYLDGYGLVLATNYRGFALVERDRRGKPVVSESRELAASEDDFWRELSRIPKSRGRALWEFLRRALTRAAPIAKAEDVADLLASYAREAADTLERRDASALAPLRESLESSLGIKFEGGDGGHFFRSTLVQTVFYGLFSAWMESDGDGKFDWKSAAFAVKTPVIRTLFSEIVNPVKIGDLGMRGILDNVAAALNRVENKDGLFRGKDAFHAIQHFYEPFLAAFDPALRKDLGVWYTPPEIVRYMVRRVDHVLRTELKVADGLASDNVRVLDPCGGTGAYLAETLRVVRATLAKRDGEKMAARGMKRAAQNRVFGFEILPASFVIAHWQIGALLAEAGAPLKNGERAAVYLTNSLTGWEESPQMDIPFRELAEERAAAGKVKREEPILVVLGNPPYNAFAGTSPAEEGDLVAPYKEGLYEEWGFTRNSLDDLYVRFFRVAERRIVKSGRGIVCYISNYSYAAEPSFVVMRRRLLREFDSIWIDSLNGDKYATGKKTPEGLPDPSVFSTDINKAGIQVGTAVGLLVRKSDAARDAAVRYRDFWGKNKRAELEASLPDSKFGPQYERADPRQYNRFSFRPMNVGAAYLRWPTLANLADKMNGGERIHHGPIERRGMSLIRFPDEIPAMLDALSAYLDEEKSDRDVARMEPRFMRDSGAFFAAEARRGILGRKRENSRQAVSVDRSKLATYPFKPFDSRVAYLDADLEPLFSYATPNLLPCRGGNNWFLVSRKSHGAALEGAPMLASSLVCDYSVVGGGARHFPARSPREVMGKCKLSPNLSEPARAYLRGLGFKNGDDSAGDAIWLHALAVGYSPEYRRENADGLRIDWPRIPLPKTRAALEKSAKLGREVFRLLDSDSAMPGIDSGDVPARLRILARLESSEEPDLSLRAGWGRRNGGRKVTPGRGVVESRDWTAKEKAALPLRVRKLLGGAADVYLNGAKGDGTFWSGVPASAWDFRIGGYQVAKKWLSYRELSVLDRPLRDEEVLHFTAMIRRLSALVLLTDELDANYRASRDNAAEWGK